jgi:hypothetical protein
VCSICGEFLEDDDCILCDGCNGWTHPNCEGISQKQLKKIQNNTDKAFTCSLCAYLADDEDAVKENAASSNQSTPETPVTTQGAPVGTACISPTAKQKEAYAKQSTVKLPPLGESQPAKSPQPLSTDQPTKDTCVSPTKTTCTPPITKQNEAYTKQLRVNLIQPGEPQLTQPPKAQEASHTTMTKGTSPPHSRMRPK